jgi:hypothetical protein
LKLAARHLLAWTVLCAIGAAGSYADQALLAEPRGYGAILRSWIVLHIPVALLGIALSLTLTRRPGLLARPVLLGAAYLLMVIVFMPCALLYLAWIDLGGGRTTLEQCWTQVMKMPRFDWFLELAWSTGTCVAVLALHAWRQARTRERQLERSSTELLQLQLALEQQRLDALRGQLEPHFLFNALNAISALVETADRDLALDAIEQLSELLRYALAAGTRNWTSLHEELQFLQQYLALQQLRHGDRLRIRIEHDRAAGSMCEVPILLLQPLVENALRHDLECHEESSDIVVRVTRADDRLAIEVSNPAGRGKAANAGLGLGLPNTAARLELLYAGAATLDTRCTDGRFTVSVLLPLCAPEGART